jgi:outer membrane protein assembly factor BamA
VQPTLGSFRWMEYIADYRRYDPIIFNFLTVATRVSGRLAVGRDESEVPTYIGRSDLLRGYNRESYTAACVVPEASATINCSASPLVGSRMAVMNAELRFPLIRQFNLGLLPIALPPVDGLAFYDMGVAWSGGQNLQLRRATSGDPTEVRYPLRSYGFGVRLNLFNFALARWDYAIPLDSNQKGFWTFSLGPSF